MHKRTKIVCTLGPASESEETIEKMVKAGMNVARLNFSHGTHENHELLIKNVRAVEKKIGEPIAIMADLQGLKIRVGLLPDKGVNLKVGALVTLDTSLTDYKNEIIPVDYAELHQYVKAGERLFLDDGKIAAKIVKVSGTLIKVEIINSGILTSHKGINVPDSKLAVRALTKKDKEDALFGLKQGVDLMAVSFVTEASDILDLRYFIKEFQAGKKLKSAGPSLKIIAKIERGEAVKNIKRILEVADGIMVARGDLGVEIPEEDVPLVQKKLIDTALNFAKPVIVATQMLDSMQENPRPTRAEVSDVANAVIDHADALMLSNETATGKYPAETVKIMSEIIIKTEESAYDNLSLQNFTQQKGGVEEEVSQMSRLLAEEVGAKLILAASLSGETGRMISRYRPELPIVVATGSPLVERQLNLSWGVKPFILGKCKTIEELVERSMVYLKSQKLVKVHDKIIVVAGEPVGESGHVNLLEVREVK